MPSPVPSAGRLILAATGIGRVEDASSRLAQTLASADVIAAEDTRRLARLLAELEITPTGEVVSYFEGNEAARTPALVERMIAGATVVVVTDAGMPSVSDPGYRLVSAAIGADVAVSAIPGPSAVLTALAVSGLPVDRFCFEGFVARKPGPRRHQLHGLATEPRTMVFFESPHRIGATLATMSEVFGPDRAAAVCRELTKTYEEIRRGTLAELAQWAQGDVRGELTLVVAGAPTPVEPTDAELTQQVQAAMAAGASRSSAIKQVAAATGVPKRRVYDLAHGR